MSRGPGRVQRAILEYLESLGKRESGYPYEAPVSRLASVVFETEEPTDAQVSSTRRAVRKLEESGHVKTFRTAHADDSRAYERWCKPWTYKGKTYPPSLYPVHICETWAALPTNLTPEQEVENARRMAELVAQMRKAMRK